MGPSAYYPMDRLAASVPAARETSTTSELARRVKEASAAQQHDVARDAFGDLVDLLQRRAVRLAYVYLRNADDADDVVQDAFVKAFTRIGDYRTEQPFDPWFLKILVNQCLDRLKARDRRARWMSPRSDDDDWQVEAVDGSPTAEDRLVHAEQASRLWEAISALPARQRTVVVLHEIDGQSPKAISAATGIGESTVRVHLFRALKKLRALMVPSDTAAQE